MARQCVLLAVYLLCCAGLGCGKQPDGRASGDASGPAGQVPRSPSPPGPASKPPVEYGKYLPDTPLNAQVAGLLQDLSVKEGYSWNRARGKLDKLFPEAVVPLLSLAENPRCEDRTRPIYCLSNGDLGPHEARVREFLRKARRDESADVRAAALYVTFFRKMPEATSELPKSAYAEKAPEVRTEVMSILSLSDAPDRERLLLLVAGLRDEDDDVVEEAIDTLGELGAGCRPVVPELRKLLASKDEYVRGAVIEALAVCGPAKQDLGAIYAACESDDPAILYPASNALFYCDLEDPKVVDLALRVFDAAQWSETRSRAAKVLAYARPVQERVVLRLAKGLQEPDLPTEETVAGFAVQGEEKAACRQALQFIGPEAAAAAPALVKEYGKKDWVLFSPAMDALRKIVPRHPEVFGYYRAQLAKGEFGVDDGRYFHVLGDDAGQFADALLALLKRTDKDVDISRDWLLKQLPLIPGIPARRLLPILLQELDRGDGNRRGYACRAIGALGAEAAPAVPALIREMNQPERGVNFARANAIAALGRIGPAASPAVPHLKRFFDDPNAYRTKINSVWHHAAVALARMDEQQRPAVLEAFRRELGSGDEDRRQQAFGYLRDIGPAAAPLLPALQPVVKDPNSVWFGLAAAAIICLGDEGAGAKLALADLRSGDDDRRIRGCEIAAFLSGQAEKARVLPVLRRVRLSRNGKVGAYAAAAIRALTGEEVCGWDRGLPPVGPN